LRFLVAMLLGMTLYKIKESPSSSLLLWIGAFVLGIAAATGIFPVIVSNQALPVAISLFLCAIACEFIIKNKTTRLIIVAGLLFLSGTARYLSTADDAVDLLKYLPALSAAKTWLVDSVGRMLPEPAAGFLNGLLVGNGVRSPELKAAFVATGTAHVMALSGWNISIISKWLGISLIFLRFKKTARWLLSAAAVIVFVIMTGAASSLVRAAVMSILMVIAQSSGRRAAPERTVLYAAAGMLLVSPRLIRADIGFLLSVAATLGMIFLAPFFKPLAAKLPERFDLSGTVAATMGATLATLPITLFAFGQVSLVALPTNILLLPLIPATMGLGFAGALISGLIPALAGPCGIVVGIFTAYDIDIVRLMARIPGAYVSNITFSLAAAAIMTALIAYVVIKHYEFLYKEKNR
jgi:competence protein ComEC